MMIFEAMASMDWASMAQGMILSVVFGFAAGNYACSLVHRLPRGRLILDKTPYCGSCLTPLQVRDLFPVISALLLRHRCRYCGASYPSSHTWTELLVGALFVLAFLQYNFGEQYFLIVFLGTFLVTLAAIEANEKMIMGRVLVCVIVFGAMFRILQDGTIYNFFEGGLLAGLIGIAITHKHTRKVGHIFVPSHVAQLLAVGGLCVGKSSLVVFFAVFAGLYLLRLLIPRIPLTAVMGVAVMIPVLFPESVNLIGVLN